MRQDGGALLAREVVRVHRDAGGADLVVSADMLRVRARVDDHADRLAGDRLHRRQHLVGVRVRAAVDENHAVFAEMRGDVRARAEDHVNVGADLNRLEAAGGRRPLRWLVDGRPLPPAQSRRTLYWQPAEAGFVRLTVIDARGHSARATVRLAP